MNRTWGHPWAPCSIFSTGHETTWIKSWLDIKLGPIQTKKGHQGLLLQVSRLEEMFQQQHWLLHCSPQWQDDLPVSPWCDTLSGQFMSRSGSPPGDWQLHHGLVDYNDRDLLCHHPTVRQGHQLQVQEEKKPSWVDRMGGTSENWIYTFTTSLGSGREDQRLAGCMKLWYWRGKSIMRKQRSVMVMVAKLFNENNFLSELKSIKSFERAKADITCIDGETDLTNIVNKFRDIYSTLYNNTDGVSLTQELRDKLTIRIKLEQNMQAEVVKQLTPEKLMEAAPTWNLARMTSVEASDRTLSFMSQSLSTRISPVYSKVGSPMTTFQASS